MKATIEQLKDLLDERIVVLDGSYGVLIQKTVKGEEAYRGERFADHPRDLAGDPDLLNLTQPDVVRDIHQSYLDAGADVVTTNTFTATTIGQADYGLEQHAHEMNVEGARLAREAADELDRPAWVAGSIGPLNVSLSLSPKVDDPAFRSATFDQVQEAYADQIRALAEGGVDILMIETIFDTLNSKAAVVAAKDVAPDLPLWISFTAIDKSGRNLSVRPSRRSGRRSSTPIRSSSASTAHSALPRCVRSWRTSRGWRRRTSRAIRMRVCRTRWASTTSSRETRAGSWASSRGTVWSTWSAAAAARRRST